MDSVKFITVKTGGEGKEAELLIALDHIVAYGKDGPKNRTKIYMSAPVNGGGNDFTANLSVEEFQKLLKQ